MSLAARTALVTSTKYTNGVFTYKLVEFLELKQDQVILDMLAYLVVQCIALHHERCGMWDDVALRDFEVSADTLSNQPIKGVRLNKKNMSISTTMSGPNALNLLTRTWNNVGIQCDYTEPSNIEYFHKHMFNYLTQPQQDHIKQEGQYLEGLTIGDNKFT